MESQRRQAARKDYEVITLSVDRDLDKKLHTGLTGEEVRQKQEAGLVNGDVNIKTKTYWQIIRENLFTFFNFIMLVLVICIISVRSWKNTLFFATAVFSFCTGVFQEIQAKRTIDKLSILTAPKVYALRDGKYEVIQVKDILLGEIIEIRNGSQIPADCVVLSGECQVNESLLTGESTPIFKKEGDRLLSGSFIISGKVICEVTHIGEDNYVNKITAGAKYYKKRESVILRSVNGIVKVTGIAVIPMAALQIWKQLFNISQTVPEAVVKIVASITSMIPSGLVVLVCMKLAESVIKLARHNTLCQDLYSVENLSRVDVLCLDKTGTITEGKMKVEEVIELEEGGEEALKAFCADIDDENATIGAIREFYDIKAAAGNARTIPFSSDKKWSLVYKEGLGTLVLGAPEFLCPGKIKDRAALIEEKELGAKRVLLLAKSEKMPEGKTLPDDITPKSLIIIGDKVRENAKETLGYFKEQGVELKVVSGDNPKTVSVIAAEAGLEGADKYIDASSLHSYEEIEAVIDEYTIFGRVSPDQKLDIVKALKAKGHTVAMTGDGVNDVLALKESDCSIAMNSGADAAKNVSDLVLLDSDFSSLPLVVWEGRRCINNLQRSAALFLTKTTYSFLITIIFLFLPFAYPFEGIQITVAGFFTEGIPSFFLALEPNKERIKDHFLRNVLRIAVPSGVITCSAIMTTVLISKYILGASSGQISTIAAYTLYSIAMVVLFDICGRLNKWKWFVFALSSVCLVLSVVLFQNLLSFVALTAQMYLVLAAAFVIYGAIHIIVFRAILPRREKKN